MRQYHISIQPEWKETPDYERLARVLLRVAEQELARQKPSDSCGDQEAA